MGGNVLFATLNQMNEIPQKVIAITSELYVLNLLFNGLLNR